MPAEPFRAVTLEMSLKPFREGFGAANLERVCRLAVAQWSVLLRHAASLQVLLWTGDGSEILEYAGDPAAELEWARWLGGANRHQAVPSDPQGIALHSRRYPFHPHPPRVTYRDLAAVVDTLKRVGGALTGLPVRVGATFDPGPEFAISRFKYEWHPEICLADTMGAKTFATCYARLAGDARAYAGFPQGIPDGLPFATFLGRQMRLFAAACGFDYLWLSNGFGFGLETWGITGAVFDGTAFHPERRHDCGAKVLEFWRLLRRELPDLAIETRGTNLTTGTDLGSDGVPLAGIYRGGFAIQAPPNSPWAALDNDFGLELAGWMSHVAELPADRPAFPFRFYIHDPWWLNSPWLDRYGGEAHDIWLPGAVARLDAGGAARVPDRLNLLSIDDSLGDMPERVPNEVIPHLLEVRRTAPDQAGPLVWAYPFDEYHARALDAGAVEEPLAGDWLVRGAVNEGLPLNTVVSATSAAALLARGDASLAGRLLITPVPRPGEPLATALPAWVAAGGRVLLYGSTAHADPAMRALIGVAVAPPLAGEGAIELAPDVADDRCAQPAPHAILHRELLNDGGCGEVADTASALASYVFASGRRAAATVRRDRAWRGGLVLWVRGTNAVEYRGGFLPVPDPLADRFPPERLLRLALVQAGWSLRARRRTPGQPGPVLTIHRSANAWWFAGLNRSTTVGLGLASPDGAPLLIGHDAWLEDGHAWYDLPRAWRRQCCAFVRQAAPGELRHSENTHELPGATRRLWIHGLVDAEITIYPEGGRTTTLLRDPPWPFTSGGAVEHAVEDGGRRIVCRHVTGSLAATW